MAEDRPLDDVAGALATLRAELEDKYSTLLARAARLPTGTTLWTLATVAPAGTVLLQGQTLNRADYPDLWAWVQASSAAGFGVGNGTTTFVLPDMRGRIPRGTPASGETVGQQVGADTRTLTTANLPSHDHGSDGSHTHSGGTTTAGSHNGHNAGSVSAASALPGSQDFFFSVASTTQNANGSHSHGMDLDAAGTHVHASVGSGTGFDNRPAATNGNWLIWC